ncbi:HAD-IIA family hydrolase [Peptoniphilus sp. oral taxon 386]|uniref:HAD-IIA family hydrolase n=1 Tax=Peptoniphilus sp. oral taxon 386 TaxID=652713 RepID=UPI0001DA9DDC|nr:HAD-IIA family hydrolase [Peptoniphilus sp. oral taxon 386]EFI41439.1 HAD hydrolase, family IIA [Peptoniphilus sp. oral taxon 386 str. F0131]
MIKDFEVFLLDMDGTVYLGDKLIDGADYFFESLIRNKKKYIFVTNNSSKNADDYVKKLTRLKIPAVKEQIFSSADATIIYIKKNYKDAKNIFLLGTESLENYFSEAGFNVINNSRDNIDLVVLGFDTTLTYEKLWMACDLIRDRGFYIATHPDFNCPLEEGKFMPDAGAMIAFIEASTNIKPLVIGKPNEMIISALCEKYGYDKSKLIIVGDRLYTDIKTAETSNIKSALVYSGETTRQMYNNSEIRADYEFNSVYDIARELDK